METIYALATAPGRAGIAVVRVSGPGALDAVRRLCGCLPPPRRASLRQLHHAGEVLDEALVLVFEAGSSFTGEAVVELQLHGSPAVVRAVLGALAEVKGLRLAEPGEFTRRALENGRLDIAQVEGLADLLAAETEVQRRQAQRVFSGAVGRRAEAWRRRLIRAAALIEATIDFADEDVPVDVAPEVRSLLEELIVEFRAEIDGSVVSERIRDGFEVAVVGRPNTGKSTLINYIAGREAALTSEVAGTTRDVIEVKLDLAGLAVTVLDTAGVREAETVVERLGIDRALERAQQADLRLFLVENVDEPLPVVPGPEDLIVVGKGDLAGRPAEAISGLTGQGVADVVRRIGDVLSSRVAFAGTVTRQRHRAALDLAQRALSDAVAELAGPCRGELCAEEIRLALRALDTLVGRVDVEHILNDVFGNFCIGK